MTFTPSWKRPVKSRDGYIDPSWSKVALLMRMNGPLFTDSSNYGHIITPFNNVKISTTTTKFPGGSGDFDGDLDYLTVPGHPAFNLNNSDGTVELWFYKSTNKTATLISQQAHFWRLQTRPDGKIEYVRDGVGAIVSSDILSINAWHHVAICKLGSTTTLYLNGVPNGTTTGIPTNSNNGLWIGINPDSLTSTWSHFGFIDEIRVSRVARYNGAFSPPAHPFPGGPGLPADPFWSSTRFLLNMDGTDGSTTIRDSSGYNYNITNNNGNFVVTNFVKYGTGSLRMPGNATIGIPSITITGDYTLEAWVSASNIAADMALFGSTTGNNQLLRFNGGGTGFLYSYATSLIMGGSSTNLSGLVSNTFYHVAQTRSGSVVRDFINGSLIQQNNAFTGSIVIDRIGAGFVGTNNSWNGHLDDVRITIGAARYTAAFTPPTGPFQAY